jgi:hypothetical protein
MVFYRTIFEGGSRRSERGPKEILSNFTIISHTFTLLDKMFPRTHFVARDPGGGGFSQFFHFDTSSLVKKLPLKPVLLKSGQKAFFPMHHPCDNIIKLWFSPWDGLVPLAPFIAGRNPIFLQRTSSFLLHLFSPCLAFFRGGHNPFSCFETPLKFATSDRHTVFRGTS